MVDIYIPYDTEELHFAHTEWLCISLLPDNIQRLFFLNKNNRLFFIMGTDCVVTELRLALFTLHRHVGVEV
jgi:hypothetical protein